MTERRLIPFDPNRLSREEADLQVDGMDSDFGGVNSKAGFVNFRRMMVERDGQILFDKLAIDPSCGAFVVPVRINLDNKAEFLLVNEYKDMLGKKIPNIIQGRTRDDEDSAVAARRLVREEAGYEADQLALIGRQIFDSAYMSRDQPYYLALIPFNQERQDLRPKQYEDIEVLPWMSTEEVRRLGINDGKTTIGIALAQGVLNPKLL